MTAKEMFEKLGYDFTTEAIEGYAIGLEHFLFVKENCNIVEVIGFNLKMKIFWKEERVHDGNISESSITIEEFEAITKQIKEFRWLDD